MAFSEARTEKSRDDWNTPEDVVEMVLDFFNDDLDLDPCSNATSIVPAKRKVMLPEDGLSVEWLGNTFVNCPYGREQVKWIEKAFGSDANTLLLIPARPDTRVWQDVIFPHADAICFIRGRITFLGAKQGAQFPSALVYFSKAPLNINQREVLDAFGYSLVLP